MNIPAELKYTEDHEWIKLEGDTAIVGVTEFAQGELGDIVYVEVETVGEDLSKGDAFGTIEAVKTVSDLFIPITGSVVEFNEEIEANPEKINEDPYGAGWIVKLSVQDASEFDTLLTAEAYKELIGA